MPVGPSDRAIDFAERSARLSEATVEISGLIRQIVAGLRAQFEKKTLDLQVLSHQKIVVQTDPYQLSQAIYTLLTNAYKFTESGGTVSLSYQLVGTELVITVQDTGIGIAQDDQSRIFDAYFRGNNSLNTAGEGIGLYIAKENLRKIGGNIELESTPDKGSRFSIRLPVEHF